jgi:NAD(P)-dependent dehydrogenase (short-subunit alcohol dehydrogenase family)
MKRLEGKHALVTGGGTGIGAAIAVGLAHAGAKVTVTGRRIEALNETCAMADGIFSQLMDVTDPDSILAATRAAIDARGPTVIHVANAGIAETSAVGKMTLEFWHRTMRTNLDGAFLSIQASLESMQQAGWGRVITVASIAGLKGLQYGSAYSASKHGLIGLTRVISEEYMGTGITANALCPGYVRTPIVARNAELIKKRSGLSDEDALASMVRSNRHKRIIEPEEVAQAALWVCGPNSGSINGQTIEIAGGQV